MPSPRIKHIRAFTLRGGGADYHDQGEGHWIDDHIATPMAPLSGVSRQPQELRPQRARHAGGRGRGRQRRHRLRRHHRRRDRRLDRREPPRPLHRGPARHRHREDVGPDVQRDPVLRPPRHRPQRDLRRRPRAVGPARPAPPGTGLRAARRPGPRRADLLRHRRPPRPRQEDGLHRRQDAAPARPRRGRGRHDEEPRPPRRHARTRRRRLLADVRLLDEPRSQLRHPLRPQGRRLRPEVDRGGAAARRLLGLRRAEEGRARPA